ncbi:MAG: cardiolipin synthase [Alphaproteobacteria bacterium]
MIGDDLGTLLSVGAFVIYCLAAWCIAQVIQSRRSPQSIVAWGISLLAFPLLTLPLYAVLGRNRFHGYVRAHRTVFAETSREARALEAVLQTHAVDPPEALAPFFATVRNITALPFTGDNAATLLINGEETYGSMLEAIASAQDYVLLQSYIVHDDFIGRRFRDALVARAAAGVAVYFLYDEIGCVRLPNRYLKVLRAGGVTVAGFKTTRGPGNRWQINFRNHRKILVVDGRSAYLGGLNIGDEYLHRNPRFGHWRDTHLRLAGPAVQMTQMAFLEDWYWADRTVPALSWLPQPSPGDGLPAVVVRTGPADAEASCALMVVQAFNSARRRLWVTAGYFVPDETIIRSLQLAALRGVDVRLLLPSKADIRSAWIASFATLPPLFEAGVKVFLYRDGVLHQKVILVDDMLASVSSVNLDNRSLHINFEIMAFVADPGFAAEVERMLEADFARAEAFTQRSLDAKPYLFRLTAKAVHLAAPLL